VNAAAVMAPLVTRSHREGEKRRGRRKTAEHFAGRCPWSTAIIIAGKEGRVHFFLRPADPGASTIDHKSALAAAMTSKGGGGGGKRVFASSAGR